MCLLLILTANASSLSRLPLHDLHFTDIFRPSPSHDEQVETCWNCPKKVFCNLVTFPEPLHELHVDFSVPGSALEPLQESHISYLSTRTSFSVPKADSSKEIFKHGK